MPRTALSVTRAFRGSIVLSSSSTSYPSFPNPRRNRSRVLRNDRDRKRNQPVPKAVPERPGGDEPGHRGESGHRERDSFLPPHQGPRAPRRDPRPREDQDRADAGERAQPEI